MLCCRIVFLLDEQLTHSVLVIQWIGHKSLGCKVFELRLSILW